jgi:N6-adenosine-specific RNA methylase IME4
MSVDQLRALPIADLADDACHLWLWTTNQFLRSGFDLLDAWGFTFLSPITWVKPHGIANWFISRTQTMLFGYKKKCVFPLARYQPNVVFAPPGKHSQKPEASYELIESISPEPRLELFARKERAGWICQGNEIDGNWLA